jgi:hypothetical protein
MSEDYMGQLGLGSLLTSSQATVPFKPGYSAVEPKAELSWWDQNKDTLTNKGFVSGALGLGQLGLGLASYLQQKPVMEEQLKGLKQNRKFAAETMQNRRNISAAFKAPVANV